jgi:hypothetical protein
MCDHKYREDFYFVDRFLGYALFIDRCTAGSETLDGR